jgi:hypothetical protein
MLNKSLVIIPGAYPYFVKKNPQLKHLFEIVYKYFELKPHSDKKFRQLVTKMRKHYKNVYFLNYKRKLHELIDPNNLSTIRKGINKIEGEYDILCFSFGGLLVQRLLNDFEKTPEKILFVGSLNLNSSMVFPKGIEVINLYSTKDILIKKIIEILAKEKGHQRLKNARNVSIQGLSHSEVELDYSILGGKYKKIKTHHLIKNLLIEK